ncbi:MAG: hypothetical protein JG781_623 [Peptococcaceae bacterium]|jgi:hypothetical protein|nr:hypothetical protein [Peptococcaceae bacterium]
MTDTNMMPQCPLYPQEHLEAMYPDIYHRVYPMIRQCCEIYDVPTNPGFYPYPTRAAVEQMADYIHQRVMADPASPAERQFGGGLLRALILILLIRELLRRRRSI